MIEDEALMRTLDTRSRLGAQPDFLHRLRDHGRAQPDRWLAASARGRDGAREAALRRHLGPGDALPLAP